MNTLTQLSDADLNRQFARAFWNSPIDERNNTYWHDDDKTSEDQNCEWKPLPDFVNDWSAVRKILAASEIVIQPDYSFSPNRTDSERCRRVMAAMLSKEQPAAPTGSHASAVHESDISHYSGDIGQPASPAVAEPATEGAAEPFVEALYQDFRTSTTGVKDVIRVAMAYERQRVESRLKEAEAKLADWERWSGEVLTDFRIPFDAHTVGKRTSFTYWMQDRVADKDLIIGLQGLDRQNESIIAQLRADKEQAVARERAEIAEIWRRIVGDDMMALVSPLRRDGYPDTSDALKAIHQRLTQPANRSDLPQANPSAEQTKS
jgi:hypothetical protein